MTRLNKAMLDAFAFVFTPGPACSQRTSASERSSLSGFRVRGARAPIAGPGLMERPVQFGGD